MVPCFETGSGSAAAGGSMIATDEVKSVFARAFGAEADIVAAAPGRVNLIGEHTDYNQGFVLPAAINRGTTLAGSLRGDRRVELYAASHAEKTDFSLEDLRPDPSCRWADYFKGVADRLQKGGIALKGCRAVIAGDLPQGAGLGSSASLEVAAAFLLLELSGASIPDVELIRTAQAAENEFVGVQCGIMDPFASHLGKAGHALLLDCRSLEHRWAPIPRGLKILVFDSGVKRTLAGSAYNERRSQCGEVVQRLSKAVPGLRSLRDLSRCDFEQHQGLLDPVLLKRCRHVVCENQRVLDLEAALRDHRLERAKALMEESHASLRDDYEVSCAELDLLARVAGKLPGVFGSRMTGAGFGGCTVNLVAEESVGEVARAVEAAYEKGTGRKAKIYILDASDGAKFLKANLVSNS